MAKRYRIELFGSFCTLDAAFYGEYNHRVIEAAGMVPVIRSNHRKTKDQSIIADREARFAEVQPIHRLRHAVERQFAWEDVYRKLTLRYEKKQVIAYGLRLLAASLVNYRWCFGGELEMSCDKNAV